jgi:hypothetical protein
MRAAEEAIEERHEDMLRQRSRRSAGLIFCGNAISKNLKKTKLVCGNARIFEPFDADERGSNPARLQISAAGRPKRLPRAP